MAISNAFKNRINDLAKEKKDMNNIGRTELARKMSVDFSSLANALNYGIIPTIRILTRIADYFNVSFYYLLGRTNSENFVKSTSGETFSVRIELLCNKRKVTFAQVSTVCRINRGYMKRWTKKNYTPSLEYIEILTKYFKVSPDYLIGRSDDEGVYIEENQEKVL